MKGLTPIITGQNNCLESTKEKGGQIDAQGHENGENARVAGLSVLSEGLCIYFL